MTMRLEEVVGRRIHDVRDGRGMSQAHLGRALATLLGKPWSRQAVSAAEKGGRDFKIAELVAIAHVLGTTVSGLLLPGPEILGVPPWEIAFPGGRVISAAELSRVVLSPLADESPERAQLRKICDELAQFAAEAAGKSQAAADAAARSLSAAGALLRMMPAAIEA